MRKLLVLALFAASFPVVSGRVIAQSDRLELTEAGREQLYAELESEAAELEHHSKIVRLVVKLIGPTVVHIETEKIEGRRAGGDRMVEEAGSGVIIKLKNAFYILTNWHVVKKAELNKIKIELADGREINPTKVWNDPGTDIAVMAINSPHLVPARVGNSAGVDIGDFVLAIGSPFGLSRSVTYGIVSAKGRRDLELGAEDVKFQDFIQTDAAINPGNSGGPLINLRGEVIGINTAIASNSGGNEGIGFSIPINMVMAVTRQLVERGSVVRAFLGVGLDRNFNADDAAKLGLTHPGGALINSIRPNTPAEAAHLQNGDVVLKFDEIPVEDDAHLTNIVSLTEVGRDVPIVIFRNRQQLRMSVRVGDRNELESQTRVTPARAPLNASGR